MSRVISKKLIKPKETLTKYVGAAEFGNLLQSDPVGRKMSPYKLLDIVISSLLLGILLFTVVQFKLYRIFAVILKYLLHVTKSKAK